MKQNIETNLTGEVRRRTFAALEFPKDSPIRKALNKDSLTSEHMPSKKYEAIIYHPETETNTAYIQKIQFETKKEAHECVLNYLK